jgi:hypothetical protein
MGGPSFRFGHTYIRVARYGLCAWRWEVFSRQRVTLEDGSWFYRIGALVAEGDCWFRWQARQQARLAAARVPRRDP